MGPARFVAGLPVAAALFLYATPAGHAQLSLNYYFGNLHAHTSYSDGSGTPREAYKFARDHGKLDFIAVTEHNHEEAERGASADRRDGILIARNHALYDELIAAAEEFNKDGSFVTLWGQEFSAISKGNHSNIFLIDRVITADNGDYKSLYEDFLTDHVMQFNHPWDLKPDHTRAYGRDNYSSLTKLRDVVSKHVRIIEVMNGPGTSDVIGERAVFKGEPHYRYYLTRQFRLAPSADQDNHYRNWGTATGARTVVLAPELTRDSILQAIRARRCYATMDANLKLSFEVNGQFMGSEITTTSRDLRLKYSVKDADEPSAKYSFIAVYGNPKLPDSAEEVPLPGDDDDEHTATLTTQHSNTFVYLKVVQRSGAKRETALSSPVWVKTP